MLMGDGWVDSAYSKKNQNHSQFFTQANAPMVEPFDAKALPLAVPLVMATSFRVTLRTPSPGVSFVELYRNGDETISIRNAKNKSEHLVLSSYSQCVFGSLEDALKFKMKMSPAGLFVFEEAATGNALEIEYQGRVRLVVCRNKYQMETQSWYLLQQHTLGSTVSQPCTSTDPLSLAEASEDEMGGRRQLVMHLLDSGKAAKDVGDILTLMYGSPQPFKTEVATEELCAERRQLIVKLVESGKSAKEVGKILVLMYGSTAPLQE